MNISLLYHNNILKRKGQISIDNILVFVSENQYHNRVSCMNTILVEKDRIEGKGIVY